MDTHTAKISPNGVSTDVFKEVVTLCIIVEVDGSVGIGVMSGDKVGDGTSWDSQGPQNCVCVCVLGIGETRNNGLNLLQ